MSIRIFKSRSSREALAQINRELGSDATILSRRKFRDSNGQMLVEIKATASDTTGSPVALKRAAIWGGISAILVIAITVIIILWPKSVDFAIATNPENSSEIQPIQPSVAVLAFDDMSQNKDMEWFCFGVSEEIIHKLTFIENIRVPARSSSFMLKDTDLDIMEIGRKLNVDTVLEGSVRVAGNDLRIIARLINVADGNNIWSKEFDATIDDVFAVQEEIGLAVVAALKVELSSEVQNQVVKRYTSDPEIDALYRQGWYFSFQMSRQSLERGISFFKEAIDKDPNFAPAYAGIAWSHTVIREDLQNRSTKEEADVHEKEARAAIMRAMELDKDLAEGHWALGAMKFTFDFDVAGAIKEYQQALSITPGNAKMNSDYSYILRCAGRFAESIHYAQKGVELDPLSLSSRHMLVGSYILAGEYDNALMQMDKAMELNPDNVKTYEKRIICLVGKGNIDAAVKLYEEISAGRGLIEKAYWTAFLGKRDDSLKYLNQVMSTMDERSLSSSKMAYTYIFLDENDLAFHWLEKMFEERDSKLYTLVRYKIRMEKIRSDPRWNDLLKKLGVEH